MRLTFPGHRLAADPLEVLDRGLEMLWRQGRRDAPNQRDGHRRAYCMRRQAGQSQQEGEREKRSQFFHG